MKNQVIELFFTGIILFSGAFALNISLDSTYYSVMENSTLDVKFKVFGDGKMYKIQVFSPLEPSWQLKKIYATPYGRTLDLKLKASSEGRYDVTLLIEDEEGKEKIEKKFIVEVVKTEVQDLYNQIKALEEKYGNTTEINEMYSLYKQGKFELLKLKIKEFQLNQGKTAEIPKESIIPKLVLATIIGIAAIFTLKFLFP